MPPITPGRNAANTGLPIERPSEQGNVGTTTLTHTNPSGLTGRNSLSGSTGPRGGLLGGTRRLTPPLYLNLPGASSVRIPADLLQHLSGEHNDFIVRALTVGSSSFTHVTRTGDANQGSVGGVAPNPDPQSALDAPQLYVRASYAGGQVTRLDVSLPHSGESITVPVEQERFVEQGLGFDATIARSATNDPFVLSALGTTGMRGTLRSTGLPNRDRQVTFMDRPDPQTGIGDAVTVTLRRTPGDGWQVIEAAFDRAGDEDDDAPRSLAGTRRSLDEGEQPEAQRRRLRSPTPEDTAAPGAPPPVSTTPTTTTTRSTARSTSTSTSTSISAANPFSTRSTPVQVPVDEDLARIRPDRMSVARYRTLAGVSDPNNHLPMVLTLAAAIGQNLPLTLLPQNVLAQGMSVDQVVQLLEYLDMAVDHRRITVHTGAPVSTVASMIHDELGRRSKKNVVYDSVLTIRPGQDGRPVFEVVKGGRNNTTVFDPNTGALVPSSVQALAQSLLDGQGPNLTMDVLPLRRTRSFDAGSLQRAWERFLNERAPTLAAPTTSASAGSETTPHGFRAATPISQLSSSGLRTWNTNPREVHQESCRDLLGNPRAQVCPLLAIGAALNANLPMSVLRAVDPQVETRGLGFDETGQVFRLLGVPYQHAAYDEALTPGLDTEAIRRRLEALMTAGNVDAFVVVYQWPHGAHHVSVYPHGNGWVLNDSRRYGVTRPTDAAGIAALFDEGPPGSRRLEVFGVNLANVDTTGLRNAQASQNSSLIPSDQMMLADYRTVLGTTDPNTNVYTPVTLGAVIGQSIPLPMLEAIAPNVLADGLDANQICTLLTQLGMVNISVSSANVNPIASTTSHVGSVIRELLGSFSGNRLIHHSPPGGSQQIVAVSQVLGSNAFRCYEPEIGRMTAFLQNDMSRIYLNSGSGVQVISFEIGPDFDPEALAREWRLWTEMRQLEIAGLQPPSPEASPSPTASTSPTASPSASASPYLPDDEPVDFSDASAQDSPTPEPVESGPRTMSHADFADYGNAADPAAALSSALNRPVPLPFLQGINARVSERGLDWSGVTAAVDRLGLQTRRYQFNDASVMGRPRLPSMPQDLQSVLDDPGVNAAVITVRRIDDTTRHLAMFSQDGQWFLHDGATNTRTPVDTAALIELFEREPQRERRMQLIAFDAAAVDAAVLPPADQPSVK
jgi:hypothetical protein